MNDPIYGIAGEDLLFHYLLQHRLTKLKGEIFKDVLAAIQKKPDCYEWSDDYDVKPILIECLYTKILTPEDLLKDIEVVGDFTIVIPTIFVGVRKEFLTIFVKLG